MITGSRYYRQGMTVTIGALLFLLILYTLEKTGVPRTYSIAMTGLFAAMIFVVGVFPAGTTRAERFMFTRRETGPGVGSMAAASLVALPLIVMQGGAIHFLQPALLIVLAVAICGGLALAALAFARQFNATHATDISELAYARFDSTLSPRLFALAGSIATLLLGACGIAAGTLLIGWFFALSSFWALIIMLAACFFSAALGGAATITRFAAVATFLLLLGLNFPLLLHSLVEAGFPVGHLSFGYGALEPGWELEQQLTSLGIPTLAQQMTEASTVLSWSAGTQILCGLLVLIATASLPSLVHSTANSPNDEIAGRTVRRGMLYSALIMVSLIALMAFTKTGFYQSMLGLSLAEARVEAPVLYGWAGRETELLTFCGGIPEDAAAVLTACPGGFDHIVNVPDFTINSDLMLAASPDLATQPFAFTALLVVGLVAMIIAFTAATILAGSNNLVTAYYATLHGKVASGRVFVSRLLTVLMLLFSAWISIFAISDFGNAFVFALSISATTSVPVLLATLHLRNASAAALNTALICGFAICLLYFVLADYGIDFTANTGDELALRVPGMHQAIPGELAGIIALPVALLIMAAMAGLREFANRERGDAEREAA